VDDAGQAQLREPAVRANCEGDLPLGKSGPAGLASQAGGCVVVHLD
jgi:hypothetical protein